MAVVKVELPDHCYEVRIKPGALAQLGLWLKEVAPHDRAALFADQAVDDTHGQAARRSIQSAGYELLSVAVSASEPAKDLDTVRSLYEPLLNARMERKSPIVALGGGVTGDTVGFVASTYLRGVPLVQCPTTLLAMVDASVGGKVGVNVPQGKNLIGSFYQPRLVVIDTESLATLPPGQLRCGLAECVKHAMIRDAELFDWIEANLDAITGLDSDTLVALIERNVAIKAAVVMADEKETGQRAHPNFGHTFAHAIESTQAYGGHQHGEAVSIGMLAAAHLAVSTGRCPAHVADRLARLLQSIGLPTRADDLPSTVDLVEAMAADKKVADGRIRFVLPDRIGHVDMVADVPRGSVAAAWDAIRK